MSDGVIRIQFESFFQKSFAFGKIPIVTESGNAERDVSFRQIRVERDGFLRGFLCRRKTFVRRFCASFLASWMRSHDLSGSSGQS